MGKADKDPNRPKRAMTGFMCFSKETRPKVLQEQPELKFGEVGKLLGARWNQMTVEEKEPYNKLAAVDKQRYEREKANYVPQPKAGKSRSSGKPKRAMTAYLFFCKEHRSEVKEKFPELKMVEVQKKLGEMWKAASDEEKQPFVKQAEADRKRYDDQLAKNEEQFEPPPETIGW